MLFPLRFSPVAVQAGFSVDVAVSACRVSSYRLVDEAVSIPRLGVKAFRSGEVAAQTRSRPSRGRNSIDTLSRFYVVGVFLAARSSAAWRLAGRSFLTPR